MTFQHKFNIFKPLIENDGLRKQNNLFYKDVRYYQLITANDISTQKQASKIMTKALSCG